MFLAESVIFKQSLRGSQLHDCYRGGCFNTKGGGKMPRWQDLIIQFKSAAMSNSVEGVTIRALTAVLGAYLLWLVFKFILEAIRRRIDSIRDRTNLFNLIKQAVGYGLLLLLGLYLSRLFKLNYLEKWLPAIFIVLFAGPLKTFLVVVLSYLEKNWADKTETQVDNIIFDLLNKFSGFVIYVAAVIIALDLIGINVMPFVAGAGVMGVAVGFAAKDTLSNLIAGILLIIDRPFEIGDRIEVWSAPKNSATWGDVIDIGLRATKIKTTDNIIIVIPNNEIMMRDIVNYTLISSDIRVRINIGVSYDTDIDAAKQAILEVAAQVDWILKHPAPVVVVRALGDFSIDLQLRVWIKDARRRMATISIITDRVKTIFDAKGIEIPYPKRDIHIFQSQS